jgi:hypothetical protein
LTDVEVYRGRNKLYNELMANNGVESDVHDMARQVMKLGRRVPRSEFAQRIAHMDSTYMRHLCYEWFYDAEPSATNWGPIEGVSQFGSYKYFKINTMSTVNNWHHSLYY